MYLEDIEQRLPALEAWTKYHEEEQEKVLQTQKEAINREIAANILKQTLEKGKQKGNLMQNIKSIIKNKSKKRK
jgi:hypothetical protein